MEPFAKAHGLSKTKAKQLLQQQLSYTLHKPRRKHFPTLSTLVFGIDQQWDMDLVDLQKLAKWNKGTKYLLTVIDVFSKYAWGEPFKSKSAQQVTAALEKLWKRAAPRHPMMVQTDAGTEFYNPSVQVFFDKQDVRHFSTHGDPHAAVVVRWNETLKTKMFRNFIAKSKTNVLVLPLMHEKHQKMIQPPSL